MSLHPKQMRTRALAALLALTALTAPAAAQGGQPLSPRDTARLEIAAGKRVYVDYGRPSMRGRRIVGELVPYGRVWRTGANAATTLVTETDLRIGDALVPRGTYTLYTLPTAQGWTLIVNRRRGSGARSTKPPATWCASPCGAREWRSRWRSSPSRWSGAPRAAPAPWRWRGRTPG
jgi:hypothetical protein